MGDALAEIPDVEIDTEGTFKYILVRVQVKDGSLSKDIVRGTKSAQYHSKLMKTYEKPRFNYSPEQLISALDVHCSVVVL